jgi:hypothetical protein
VCVGGRGCRHAEASDDGRLVYVFPHLQLTAESSSSAAAMAGGGSSSSSSSTARSTPCLAPPPLAPPVYERQWPLLAGGQQQVRAACTLMRGMLLNSTMWGFRGWAMSSRRRVATPPNLANTSEARTERYTYTAKVWALCLVQGNSLSPRAKP